MSFSAIVSVSKIETFLEPVSALVAECKIHLNDDGLQISAVDPANVAMVHSDLDAGAFESYEATGGVIGIDLGKFEDAISLGDSDDLLKLELNEATRKLELEIENLEYTLALIDPDSIRQEPEDVDLELPWHVDVEGRDISRAAKAADLCSDHIAFVGDSESKSFSVEAEGDKDDVSDVVVDDVERHAKIDCQSLFSLDYIKDMQKPIGAPTDVEVRFGDEMPLELEYESIEDYGQVTNQLAPRIQSD